MNAKETANTVLSKLASADVSRRMKSVLDDAKGIAGVIHGKSSSYNRHNFGSPRGNVDATSPKLSDGGLYYLTCHDCRRSVIEGGLGSATADNCR